MSENSAVKHEVLLVKMCRSSSSCVQLTHLIKQEAEEETVMEWGEP